MVPVAHRFGFDLEFGDFRKIPTFGGASVFLHFAYFRAKATPALVLCTVDYCGRFGPPAASWGVRWSTVHACAPWLPYERLIVRWLNWHFGLVQIFPSVAWYAVFAMAAEGRELTFGPPLSPYDVYDRVVYLCVGVLSGGAARSTWVMTMSSTSV